MKNIDIDLQVGTQVYDTILASKNELQNQIGSQNEKIDNLTNDFLASREELWEALAIQNEKIDNLTAAFRTEKSKMLIILDYMKKFGDVKPHFRFYKMGFRQWDVELSYIDAAGNVYSGVRIFIGAKTKHINLSVPEVDDRFLDKPYDFICSWGKKNIVGIRAGEVYKLSGMDGGN